MVAFRFLSLFFLLLDIVQADINVISSYTQQISFDNKLTTNHVATIQCSNLNPTGQLLIGDYRVNVTCVPPRVNYSYKKLATVPADVKLMIDGTCLVGDRSQFDASQASKQLQANSQTLRRLLQFDPVGWAALGVSIHAEMVAEAAMNKVNDLADTVHGVQNSIKDIYNITSGLDARLDLTQTQVSSLNNMVGLQNQSISRLNIQQMATTNAITSLSQHINDGFAAITSDLNAQSTLLEAQLQGQADQNKNNTLKVLTLLQALQDHVDTVVNQLFGRDDALTSLIMSVQSTVSDILYQRQLQHTTTKSVFDSKNQLDPTFIPLFLDQGAPPAPSGRLEPVDRRILPERADLNYVTTPVSTAYGQQYEIHNTQIRFYYNGEYAVDHHATAYPLSEILKLVGPTPDCTRPYVTPGDSSPNTVTPTACNLWIEITDNSCVTNHFVTDSGTGQPRPFDWKLDANATDTSIVQSYCGNGTLQFSTTPTVIRQLPALLTYVSNLCQTNVANNYMGRTFRGMKKMFFNTTRTNCDDSIQKLILGSQSGQASLAVFLLEALRVGFSLIDIDVLNLELKRYGRLPGGLEFETVPFQYTPTQYNGTTPIYDAGADAHNAFFAYWLAARRTVLPVYAVSPFTGGDSLVSKEIVVDIAGPPCSDPSLCFTVTNEHVKQDIILNSDANFILPSSVLQVGDIEEIGTTGVIYDVPDGLMDVTPNYFARINKVTCYMGSVNDTETQSLTTFQANNHNSFKATDCAVGAGLFRFPASADFEGYPVCNVPGGLPAAALLTGENSQQVQLCASGFTLRGATTPASPPASNSTCRFVTGQVVRYNELHQGFLTGKDATTSLDLTAGFTVSAWYQQQTPGVGDGGSLILLSVGTSNTGHRIRLVVTLGLIGLEYTDGTTTSTPAFSGATDLRDTLLHFLVFTVQGNTVKAWVDGLYRGSLVMALSDTALASTFQNSTSLTQSASASAYLLTTYPSILSVATMHRLQGCQQAYFKEHCAIASGDQSGAILALQNVTGSVSSTCHSDGFVYLQTTSGFDAAYPLLTHTAIAPFLLRRSFTLTFWLQSTPAPLPSTGIQLFNVTNAGQSVVLKATSTSATFYRLYYNGVDLGNAIAVNKQAHFVSIIVSFSSGGSSATLTLYVDGVASALTAVALSGLTAMNNNGPLSVTIDSNVVEMVKYFDAAAFTSTEVANEFACSSTTSTTSTNYVAPVGYCILDPSDSTSTHGYCRQPAMCNGHCSSYSVVDVTTGTFFAGSLQCDRGWAQPTCTTPCHRVDSVSGVCMDLIDQSFADGEIPNGRWCQLMKNYKMAANGNVNRLTMEPRQWLYTATISVPDGIITSVLGNGGCPTVNPVKLAAGGMSILLQNDNDQESNTLVTYFTQAVIDGNAACSAPCCDADGRKLSIPAHSSISFSIPECGNNMTIVVKKLVNPLTHQYSDCTIMNGDSVAAALASSIRDLPANVETRITYEVDKIRTAVSDSFKDIYSSMLVQMQLQLDSNVNQTQLAQAILVQRALVAHSQFDPLNFTASAVAINLTEALGTYAEDSRRSYQQVLDNIAQTDQYEQTFLSAETEQKRLSNITKEQLVHLMHSINVTDELLAQVDADPSIAGIGDFIRSAGNGFVDVAKTVAGLPMNIANSLFGGIFGGSGIGGFFGSIINTLLSILPIILICVVVYFLWKSGLLQKMCKSMKEKQKTKKKNENKSSTSPPPSDSRPLIKPNTQSSTSASFQAMMRRANPGVRV